MFLIDSYRFGGTSIVADWPDMTDIRSTVSNASSVTGGAQTLSSTVTLQVTASAVTRTNCTAFNLRPWINGVAVGALTAINNGALFTQTVNAGEALHFVAAFTRTSGASGVMGIGQATITITNTADSSVVDSFTIYMENEAP